MKKKSFFKCFVVQFKREKLKSNVQTNHNLLQSYFVRKLDFTSLNLAFTEHGHPINLSMSSAKSVVHDTNSCNRVLYEINKSEIGNKKYIFDKDLK